MARHHLFEFEDLSWFPDPWRDYMTDYIQFVANKMDVYKAIDPILEKGVAKGGTDQIIDLCSGGGGGLLRLVTRLKGKIPNLKVLLTDFYPNIGAFQRAQSHLVGTLGFHSKPVDARDVPEGLKGLRTMFLSFHHFKPEDASLILQNAVDDRSPIAIFEVQQRRFINIIPMLFAPLMVWLLTPFIKPFRIGRIIFTYLIPILPPLIVWDGIVSVLRTYTVDEMREMTGRLKGGDTFEWEIGVAGKGMSEVLYLLGYPKG
jgi:hypothetical protein